LGKAVLAGLRPTPRRCAGPGAPPYFNICKYQMIIPFWKIYSYWVFVMTVLWVTGRLPFSPLISAVLAFIGSALIPISYKSLTEANIFIVITHLIPIWILRKTKFDIKPNLIVFLIYNIFLLLTGTNYHQIYSDIFKYQPQTIKQYLVQRGIL
jgi:hypothetical protein